MPTYKARSVTATLRATNLVGTASTDINATNKWPQNAQTAKRIEHILCAGDRLYERPIGIDDREKDVANFVGQSGDLPFFMAETGKHIQHVSKEHGIALTTEPESRQGTSESSVASSPDPLHGAGQLVPNRRNANVSSSQHAHRGISALGRYGKASREQQALSLAVEVGSNACPPKQHLKIEVFLNGSLVDSTFVNTKRFTLNTTTFRHHFHGTRVDVQSEKPWVYQAVDDASTAFANAEGRWDHVASTLLKEVKARGCDASGMPVPSSEYLMALAAVKLPNRVRESLHSNFGIFDVIVTTGHGGKYGQEKSFITGPLRLSSANIGNIQREVTSLKDRPQDDVKSRHVSIGTDEAEPKNVSGINLCGTDSSDSAVILPSTSPDIPLAHRTRSARDSQQEDIRIDFANKRRHKPSAADVTVESYKGGSHQERFDAMVKELGLTPNKARIVTSFKNRRGKEGKPRSINERVTDILKMNVENREQAKQDLLAQLADKGILSARKTSSSASKFQRADSANVVNDGDTVMAGESAAVLAHSRMNLAMDLGAEPSGRLAKQIESLSPGQTPVKRLGAPTWASSREDYGNSKRVSSNMSVFPESLRRERARPSTGVSSMSEAMLEESKLVSFQAADSPDLPTSRPLPESFPGDMSSDATESMVTGEEVLDAFEIPDICQYTSVTYAGPALYRPVTRLRPGQFNEEEFVVGMRFVVL